MILGIIRSNHNACQATATIERIIADARHAIRNHDARQATATGERPLADACHAISNRDARQIFAIIEGTVQNITTGNGDRF